MKICLCFFPFETHPEMELYWWGGPNTTIYTRDSRTHLQVTVVVSEPHDYGFVDLETVKEISSRGPHRGVVNTSVRLPLPLIV